MTAAVSGHATEGAVYELGGPTIYSFREILQKVCECTQHKRLLLPIPFWAARAKAERQDWGPIFDRLERRYLRLAHRKP